MQVPRQAYRFARGRGGAQLLSREEPRGARGRGGRHDRRQGARRHGTLASELRLHAQVRVQVQGAQQQAGRDTGGGAGREVEISGRGQPEAQEGRAVLHGEHQEPGDSPAEGGGLGRARVPHLQHPDEAAGRAAEVSCGQRHPDRHPLSDTSPQAGVLQGVERPVVPDNGEDPRRGAQPADGPGDDGGGE